MEIIFQILMFEKQMKCIICEKDHEENPEEAKDLHKTKRSFFAMIMRSKKTKKIVKKYKRNKKVVIIDYDE